MSLNFLATRYRCTWPWDILVMLCDGRFVCGCADPYGRRVLGDARSVIPIPWVTGTSQFQPGQQFLDHHPMKRSDALEDAAN